MNILLAENLKIMNKNIKMCCGLAGPNMSTSWSSRKLGYQKIK